MSRGAGQDARPGGAPPARARWRRRLLALALATLVSLAAGELLARAAVGAPLAERRPLSRVQASPERGWAMVPGEDHYTYLHPVSVNALGLRGAEVPADKDGELRVLALGDSLTYGQGVGDDQTLPHALEEELARRDPARRWRVVNAGHRGYATNQELGHLRELGARVEPDVVMLLWFWNDLDTPDVRAIHARLSRSGPVTFDLNAPFEGRAALGWHLKQLLRRSALVMLLHDAWRAARGGGIDPDWARRGPERLSRQLDELRARCAELGATPCFVALPDAAALRGPHPTVELGERALELARAAGLATLDLLPGMRATFGQRERAPVLPYDGHYTAEANEWMGRAVGEWVLSDEGPAPPR